MVHYKMEFPLSKGIYAIYKGLTISCQIIFVTLEPTVITSFAITMTSDNRAVRLYIERYVKQDEDVSSNRRGICFAVVLTTIKERLLYNRK